MTIKLCIGMMSGTSVDGSIDAAALRTDGEARIERILNIEQRYETADGLRAVHHLTKAAEVAFRTAHGAFQEASALYPEALLRYVTETFPALDGSGRAEKITALAAEFFGTREERPSLEAVIERSTDLHLITARAALHQLGPRSSEVELIGYHGQTVYHAPAERVTVQLGSPQKLADQLGLPVVFNFRSNDVDHGGQGAPLAPVYHCALARQAGYRSAAILNLGGTANITVCDGESDAIFGFDTGPANGLIDRYVKERIGAALDTDSRLASAGTVSAEALTELLRHSIILSDGRSYLDLAPPKSLDIRDYHYNLPHFAKLKTEDGCATLNAFTAQCVVEGLKWVERIGMPLPENWILCGGGAFSPHLRSELKHRLEQRLERPINLISADEAGWSARGMEAELFAFLAARVAKGLPITFPGTTGVRTAMPGGEIFYPS